MIILPKKTLLSLALMLLIDSARIFGWTETPTQRFSLVVKDLLPCQWTDETVSLHQSGLLSVRFSFNSYCPTAASNTSARSSDHYNVG
jgi:hypothetical protein